MHNALFDATAKGTMFFSNLQEEMCALSQNIFCQHNLFKTTIGEILIKSIHI